jgi:hypothetical protein
MQKNNHPQNYPQLSPINTFFSGDVVEKTGEIVENIRNYSH